MPGRTKSLFLVAALFIAGGCGSDSDVVFAGGDVDGLFGGDPDGGLDSATDSNTDNDADSATDSDVDGDTDSDVACFDGYESASPELRFRSLVIFEPSILTMADQELQALIDDEEIIYLLRINGITGDGDFEALFGIGTEGQAAGHYSFDTTLGDPAELMLSLTGRDFASTPPGFDIRLHLEVYGQLLEIPLRETLLSGSFTTDKRCSIGEQLTTTRPTSWHEAGALTGMVAQEDAAANTINLGMFDVTLCAVLAYGDDLVSLASDPNCEADADSFIYPPDTTTADGEAAWSVEAEYAATAVHID